MAEPKTHGYWREKGYRLLGLSNCEGCGAPVEEWESPGKQVVPLDAKTLETHYSSCHGAQRLRQERKFKEGVI